MIVRWLGWRPEDNLQVPPAFSLTDQFGRLVGQQALRDQPVSTSSWPGVYTSVPTVCF